MVCLNYQTWDLPMRLNFAKFLLNGCCGYVLKPACLSVQGEAAAAASSSASPAAGGEESFRSPGVPKDTPQGGETPPPSSPSPSPSVRTSECVPLSAEASETERISCRREMSRKEAATPNSPAAPSTSPSASPAGKKEEDARRQAAHARKLAKMRGEDFDDGDLNAEYTMFHCHLVSGRQIPKVGEECCIPEVFDRYCPASRFVERLPSNKSTSVTSPVVDIQVHGGGKFRSCVGTGEAYVLGSSYTSKPAVGNGAIPTWDEHIDCVVEQPDDAIVAFHVYDRTKSESSLIGYQAIPMSALRVGWRVIKLRSRTGSRLVFGSLLVHLTRETRKGTPANMKTKRKGLGIGSKREASRHPTSSPRQAHPEHLTA